MQVPVVLFDTFIPKFILEIFIKYLLCARYCSSIGNVEVDKKKFLLSWSWHPIDGGQGIETKKKWVIKHKKIILGHDTCDTENKIEWGD